METSKKETQELVRQDHSLKSNGTTTVRQETK